MTLPVQAPAAHTPGLLDRPFRVVPGNLQHSIVGANNRAIAAAYGSHSEQAVRAEHIARCLNSHAELVEALECLYSAFVTGKVDKIAAVAKAERALSRATGSES